MTELYPENSEPERIDKWLTSHFKERSRTYFQNLITSGLVILNGEVAIKRAMVAQGDEIEVTLIEKPIIEAKPEPIALSILYEDDDLIAIDKPAGMVVHPAPGTPSGTLVNALLHHLGKAPTNDPVRPGIVHRLDKETSGVIIVAKNSLAHEKLSEMFARRLIEKRYLAIAVGTCPLEATIDEPLGRDLRNRQKMAVRSVGKRAVSHLRRMKTNGELSLVEVTIETGRTHQIRVHLAHLRTPVLGDSTYGNARANSIYGAKRQMLHAKCLRFLHPITLQNLVLESPLPLDFSAIAAKIS